MACISTTPKIIYFNGMGRAEVARLLLAQAGVDFEDERVEFGEAWTKKKKELGLVFGLPAFEINGKRYCQSLAIIQFIARKYGLYGKTAEDQFTIDMIGQCLHDVATKLPVFEKDEKIKNQKLDELFGKVYPEYIGYIEKLLPEKGFVLGTEVCLSDIGIMRMVEALEGFRAKSMDRYPKMKRIAADVEKLPNIAAYLKKRPKTAF